MTSIRLASPTRRPFETTGSALTCSADRISATEDSGSSGRGGLGIRGHELAHQRDLELAPPARAPQVAVRQDPDQVAVRDDR